MATEDGESSEVRRGRERSRGAPVGIRIVCAILAMNVPWSLLLGAGLLVAVLLGLAPVWTVLVGLATLVLGVVTVPAVYGLWTVREWGWQLGVTVYGFLLGVGLAQSYVLGVVLEDPLYVFQALFGLFVGTGVLLYLGGKRARYEGEGRSMVEFLRQARQSGAD